MLIFIYFFLPKQALIILHSKSHYLNIKGILRTFKYNILFEGKSSKTRKSYIKWEIYVCMWIIWHGLRNQQNHYTKIKVTVLRKNTISPGKFPKPAKQITIKRRLRQDKKNYQQVLQTSRQKPVSIKLLKQRKPKGSGVKKLFSTKDTLSSWIPSDCVVWASSKLKKRIAFLVKYCCHSRHN